jgi:Flp pilus assembly protein TadG
MTPMLNRLHRDERGMSLVFVALGFMSFLAAATLAIDVGMFMTARAQAQTAADAAALAGAVSLAKDDFANRSSSGPAVQSALAAARQNAVMNRSVDVAAADVTFPLSPAGLNNRVRVAVRRTAASGTCTGCSGAVPTLLGGIFGVARVDINATATAEAAPTGSVQCAKPFIIPDRWIEQTGNANWFDLVDNHNNLLANPDVYRPVTSSGYTGYSYADIGQSMMLRAGTGNQIQPSFYYSWSMGGLTGGSEYDWNIANCNQSIISIGNLLLMEPGSMVGPTNSGIDDLIARDPNARWDGHRVVSNQHPSPRVAIIPLYDPVYYATGVQQGRNTDLKVANFLGFFIESRSGNNVYGRIAPVTGVVSPPGVPVPTGAFPTVIRLVE